jgi:hypothetical protein
MELPEGKPRWPEQVMLAMTKRDAIQMTIDILRQVQDPDVQEVELFVHGKTEER